MRSGAVLLGLMVAVAAVAGAQQASQPLPKFQQMVAEAKKAIREVSVEDVKARLDRKEKFLLVDVREDHEWAEGRVPGAIHMARGVLEKEIEKAGTGPGAAIVLYCHSGARSALAAESLKKMGYTNVSSMAGGIAAWEEKGFPVGK